MFRPLKRFIDWGRKPSGHVYYARLKTPQGVFYKIGYTKKSTLMARLAYSGCGDERFLDREFIFSFHDDAYNIEQRLLRHFDKDRAFRGFLPNPKMPLPRRGQSELFRFDVLGLDDDLYKLSNAEMAKTINAAENEQMEGCFLVVVALVLIPFTLGLSLFLIAGGLSGVFGGENIKKAGLKGVRPVHPPEIQELIDLLRKPQ